MKLKMLAEAMVKPENQEKGSVPGAVLQKMIGSRGVVLTGRGGAAQAVVIVHNEEVVAMDLPQFWSFAHQTEGTLFSASLTDVMALVREIGLMMSVVSPDLSRRSDELTRKWRSFSDAWERHYSDVTEGRHT